MSKIQWTEQTWNPITGCSRVSTGCENCYAERMAWRMMNNPVAGEAYANTTRKTKAGRIQWTGRINTVELALTKPLRVKRPTMFFVNSMSDLFHPEVPPEFLQRIWAVMNATPRHTYQILTKRPELIRDKLPKNWGEGYPNVWLGVSVESENYLFRAGYFREIKSPVRFLSVEPMLGPVRLTLSFFQETGINWVIIGGESGPMSRKCSAEWINDLKHDCISAGVPVFIKQLGSHTARLWKLRDKKGGDIAEWPPFFQVRQYPQI